MNIEMVELARLKPYSENPRINDAGVDAVAASIKAFGVQAADSLSMSRT